MANIRIISGTFGRRLLTVPNGNLIRPTSDRVREAMFNVLDARIEFAGVHVLDLFAGTGALGLEAISRGADSCLFVDSHPMVLTCCKNNAAALNVSDQCQFLRYDAARYIDENTGAKFGLILADPPYNATALSGLPDKVVQLLDPGGVFVLEHDKRITFSGHEHLLISKSYGRTNVSFFRILNR